MHPVAGKTGHRHTRPGIHDSLTDRVINGVLVLMTFLTNRYRVCLEKDQVLGSMCGVTRRAGRALPVTNEAIGLARARAPWVVTSQADCLHRSVEECGTFPGVWIVAFETRAAAGGDVRIGCRDRLIDHLSVAVAAEFTRPRHESERIRRSGRTVALAAVTVLERYVEVLPQQAPSGRGMGVVAGRARASLDRVA
jgi:hypothetical protein